jgi:hypothetical protein
VIRFQAVIPAHLGRGIQGSGVELDWCREHAETAVEDQGHRIAWTLQFTVTFYSL